MMYIDEILMAAQRASDEAILEYMRLMGYSLVDFSDRFEFVWDNNSRTLVEHTDAGDIPVITEVTNVVNKGNECVITFEIVKNYL